MGRIQKKLPGRGLEPPVGNILLPPYRPPPFLNRHTVDLRSLFGRALRLGALLVSSPLYGNRVIPLAGYDPIVQLVNILK